MTGWPRQELLQAGYLSNPDISLAEMTAYIPSAHCERCNAPAQSVERKVIRGRRVIEVRCHGETAHIGFASEPGQVVRVFASLNDVTK